VTVGAAELSALELPRRAGVRHHVRAFARTYPGGALGAVMLLAFVALALAGSFLHGSAYDNDLVHRLQPPLWSGGDSDHLLGTDSLGRDVFARILVAIRISLLVAAASVLVAGVVGVSLGLLAGYLGGWVDDVVMRATDTMLAVPIVLLAITVMTVLEPGIRSLVFVIALTQWMTYARVVRGEVLAVKHEQFVTAARAVGAGNLRVLRRHVLPQVLPSAIALATLNVSIVVLLEAGLSYLGLGVQLPDPSLGSLLNEGRQYVSRASWLAVYPGLALLLLVLAVNLFGDGLRAYLDPETRK
jgi:peptide/nickel transport system permease protein